MFFIFLQKREIFNNFIIGRKNKIGLYKSIIQNNCKILVYERREEL